MGSIDQTRKQQDVLVKKDSGRVAHLRDTSPKKFCIN